MDVGRSSQECVTARHQRAFSMLESAWNVREPFHMLALRQRLHGNIAWATTMTICRTFNDMLEVLEVLEVLAGS